MRSKEEIFDDVLMSAYLCHHLTFNLRFLMGFCALKYYFN